MIKKTTLEYVDGEEAESFAIAAGLQGVVEKVKTELLRNRRVDTNRPVTGLVHGKTSEWVFVVAFELHPGEEFLRFKVWRVALMLSLGGDPDFNLNMFDLTRRIYRGIMAEMHGTECQPEQGKKIVFEWPTPR